MCVLCTKPDIWRHSVVIIICYKCSPVLVVVIYLDSCTVDYASHV